MGMNYQPMRTRKNIRLPNYDYSRPGMYFITFCTHARQCFFGGIAEGQMILNHAGMMIQTQWLNLPARFPSIEMDEMVIMPDHIHGIIKIVENTGEHKVRPYGTSYEPIGRVIQAFKSVTTNEYARRTESDYWPTFNGKLWQRNYWERIIRSDNELDAIRDYIRQNPKKWRSP
jgi:putative transposase